MKKSYIIIVFSTIIITQSFSQTTVTACPGSGVKCEATVTGPDGTSATVNSQKDKNGDAIIIKQN